MNMKRRRQKKPFGIKKKKPIKKIEDKKIKKSAISLTLDMRDNSIDLSQYEEYPIDLSQVEEGFFSLKYYLNQENFINELFQSYSKVGLSNQQIGSLIGTTNEIAGGNINRLLKMSIPPEIVIKYDSCLEYYILPLLYNIGCTPDKLTVKKQKKLSSLLTEIIFVDPIYSEPTKFSFIDSGGHSIVLLKENSAWKFSQNINYEANLLSRLKDSENIVKIKGNVKENLAVELEYINGKTIEQICEKDKPINLEKAVKYSADILNGILEMRNAGIYHRDLHDRNILIDEDKDRAVIIDLGSATDDSNLVYEGPRTYYGNNDLVNLGQLMYKMVTGHHLFKTAPGFTFYSETKENIKLRRTQAYCNSKVLEPFLDKVRENVEDKKLAGLIINLLDDNLWTQPSLERVNEVKKMFEGYLR